MAKVYIDNDPVEMDDSQNLLHACLSKGLSIQYFCWHPAMGSVGACRQCAVKLFRDENDKRGRIVMSCMTPVKDGMRISIEDPEVKDFRARVIEWLMINHPHDCPVCDEGGECHLQDMTLMSGHIYRRYRFQKRTFVNQDLGPFVNHEMNRCIACYRCVRYYRDYAGGKDLVSQACHNLVYFGRENSGALESEFSGNLVEICPTGVFTDKTLKQHYTRKWDLQTAPSICVHCSVGCNTFPGERYGELRRVHNRYNSDVNRYFLCDRGRYGYEFVNSSLRIRSPLTRERKEGNRFGNSAGEGNFISAEDALKQAAALIGEGKRFIGIGSPRASVEANYALRALVGSDRFYAGISNTEYKLTKTIRSILSSIPIYTATLPRMENADLVVVLGEDITQTAPLMALALRQSIHRKPMRRVHRLDIPEWNDGAVKDTIRHEKGPFFVLSVLPTKLDDIATETCRAAPDDIARIGFAIAHAMNNKSPKVDDLPRAAQLLVERIVAELRDADNPLVVCGVSNGSEPMLHAAANLALSLCDVGCPGRLALALPECNSMGLALFDAKPLVDAFAAIDDGEADSAIILENDLYRRADEKSVDAFLGKCHNVITLDSLWNKTSAMADLTFPAGTFAESDGTLVNYEGRAQRFYQVFVPKDGEIQESWRWIRDIGVVAGQEEFRRWRTFDDLVAEIAKNEPVFWPLRELAPPASFRLAGQKIAREPHRYSGRTAMNANISVHEPKPPDDPDSALAFSMEGYDGQPPAPLVPRFWAPAWNSVQAVTRFQEEVNGPLRGGPEGKRLIEPPESDHFKFFEDAPKPFERRNGQYLLVPVHYTFGSDELSMLTPGVAHRAPQPHIAISTDDARQLDLIPSSNAEVIVDGISLQLPVEISAGIPAGLAALPAGLPQLQSIMLPGWGSIAKARTA